MIGGLGIQELHRLMPGIIQTAERSDIPSHVRDGYIMLYIYLPVVFEKDFLQYIGPIIPSILKVCNMLWYLWIYTLGDLVLSYDSWYIFIVWFLCMIWWMIYTFFLT